MAHAAATRRQQDSADVLENARLTHGTINTAGKLDGKGIALLLYRTSDALILPGGDQNCNDCTTRTC